MSYKQAMIDIYTEFETQWLINGRSMDNVAFENVDSTAINEDWWVLIRINDVTSESLGVGSNAVDYEHRGFVTVFFFVKPNTATAFINEIIDEVNAIFRGRRISNIIFRSPQPTGAGFVNKDGNYEKAVNYPYIRDEVITISN